MGSPSKPNSLTVSITGTCGNEDGCGGWSVLTPDLRCKTVWAGRPGTTNPDKQVLRTNNNSILIRLPTITKGAEQGAIVILMWKRAEPRDQLDISLPLELVDWLRFGHEQTFETADPCSHLTCF